MKANKQLLLMQIHIFTDKADCFSWSFKIQTCISWIYSPLFTEVQKWQFFLFIFFVSAFSLVNIRCLLSKQKNKSMWCLHFCHCICDNSKPKSVLGQPQSLFSTWRKIAPDKKKKKNPKHNHLWDLIIPLQSFLLEMAMEEHTAAVQASLYLLLVLW